MIIFCYVNHEQCDKITNNVEVIALKSAIKLFKTNNFQTCTKGKSIVITQLGLNEYAVGRQL